ncbi:MAG: hypothetical protein COA78_28515 [Blastopirellula sp.]|nr:MAG: hypothetical protein COA78_28515 [Blastopirellula sp.]
MWADVKSFFLKYPFGAAGVVLLAASFSADEIIPGFTVLDNMRILGALIGLVLIILSVWRSKDKS